MLTGAAGALPACHLRAKLLCLHNVERFEAGGVRDAVAGVVGRYREEFRSVEVRAPRPKHGVIDLPCTCPICGAAIRLQANSWLRSNLPVHAALVVLGIVITVLGWLNRASVGMIATVVMIFGIVIITLPVLLALVAPGLMDRLSTALQIVQDVPRAEPFWIIGGGGAERMTARELRDRGMNQHKLDAVHRAL
jgi:hypothetical protein